MTGGFQLSLHAANAKSQRTVFAINVRPFFYYGGLSHRLVNRAVRLLKFCFTSGFFGCQNLGSVFVLVLIKEYTKSSLEKFCPTSTFIATSTDLNVNQ